MFVHSIEPLSSVKNTLLSHREKLANSSVVIRGQYGSHVDPSEKYAILLERFYLGHTFCRYADKELEIILDGVKVEVESHHFKRLNRISLAAQERGADLKRVWEGSFDLDNDLFGDTDYEDMKIYYTVLYKNYIELSSLNETAERLSDFVGVKK